MLVIKQIYVGPDFQDVRSQATRIVDNKNEQNKTERKPVAEQWFTIGATNPVHSREFKRINGPGRNDNVQQSCCL